MTIMVSFYKSLGVNTRKIDVGGIICLKIHTLLADTLWTTWR